ncbi:MAG: trypsin-like peptidase domain-containing protein [Acetobacteraceae bacterium]|nr:trypsin-like peptidase domain-containing protein [Acetobacteraceae bacterium]
MKAALPPVWRYARVLMMALALSACTAATEPASARVALDSFAPLVKKVLPAVVNIAVTETITGSDVLAQLPPELRGTPFERQFRDRFRNRREQMMGAGSGFIIDPSGVIVTNNHVVGHADRIVVSLSDGTELPARVIGHDDLTDIAVIKVSAPKPLPYVSWGDSRQLEAGDWILAAGNPFGLGGSVTAGIVSARGREIGAGPFDDFLQLDAPINPGNSGGPTFNMDGQVIGINTAIVSPTGGSVGIGFAIPSEIVAPIVNDLLSKGRIERGWLGVSVQDAPAGEAGVAIASVERSGPAARAGIRPGDIVVAVNGDKIDTARGLIRAVAATPPGNNVRLSVRRQGRDMDLSVTVGRRPPETAG